MRMDLQSDLNALLFRRSFENAADRRGGEAVATNQHRHIRPCQHEFEAQFLRAQFRDFQLSLRGIINEFNGYKLQKISKSVCYRLHGPIILHPSRLRKLQGGAMGSLARRRELVLDRSVL